MICKVVERGRTALRLGTKKNIVARGAHLHTAQVAKKWGSAKMRDRRLNFVFLPFLAS